MAAWPRFARAAAGPAAVAAAATVASAPAPAQRRRPAWPRGPVRAEGAPAAIVTNWADPKKAANLEAEYQKQDVVRQRSEIRALLRPLAGERVLDVGCGPGFLMRELSGAVGRSGHVEGVDPSAAMCQLAQARLQGMSNISIKVGTAEALPYEDASFDAVVLSQVLLYVSDVPKALGEVKRVLRPGGRLVICDTDWNSLVVNTEDRELFGRVFAAICSTFVHAHLPPQLPGVLAQAGMPLCEARTLGMVSAGSEIEGSFMENWAFNVVPDKGRNYGLSEKDIEAWLVAQRDLRDQGAFFACVQRFLFLARRP